MTDPLVEAVARAIYEAAFVDDGWDSMAAGDRAVWYPEARAAIAAIREAEVMHTSEPQGDVQMLRNPEAEPLTPGHEPG